MFVNKKEGNICLTEVVYGIERASHLPLQLLDEHNCVAQHCVLGAFTVTILQAPMQCRRRHNLSKLHRCAVKVRAA